MVTSSQDWKLERARELGAEMVVNSKTDDWVERARQWTDGKGVDVVIESLGGEYLSRSMDAVRRGGRIVSFGRTVGKSAEIDIFKLFWHHISLIGSTMGSAADFTGMLDFVNTYQLRPVIDSVYPLEQIGEAFRRMDNAEQFGKIVLRMNQ
jgi:zinc-binding alcohol dehydrogenase/oxidoreductase